MSLTSLCLGLLICQIRTMIPTSGQWVEMGTVTWVSPPWPHYIAVTTVSITLLFILATQEEGERGKGK